MKKIHKLVTLVLLVVFHFTACQKKPVINPPVEVEVCKITHTTTDKGDGNFTYNSFGNPKRVITTNVGTGNPHENFLYDQYNRLTDHIGTYFVLPDSINRFSDLSRSKLQFSFEYWYRYTYADVNPNSLPIGDTVLEIGAFSQGKITITSLTFTEAFVYDSQQRIVQVISQNPVSARTYNYDANGNLITPDVTYDTKKNYRLTSKVWMFVDRNFSKNNPFIATAYNSEGYPTVFPDPKTAVVPYENFRPRPRYIYTMDYTCSTLPKAE